MPPFISVLLTLIDIFFLFVTHLLRSFSLRCVCPLPQCLFRTITHRDRWTRNSDINRLNFCTFLIKKKGKKISSEFILFNLEQNQRKYWNVIGLKSKDTQSNLWTLYDLSMCNQFQWDPFIWVPFRRWRSTSDMCIPFTFFTIKNTYTPLSSFSQWFEGNHGFIRNFNEFGKIDLIFILFCWCCCSYCKDGNSNRAIVKCLQVERKKIDQNNVERIFVRITRRWSKVKDRWMNE